MGAAPDHVKSAALKPTQAMYNPTFRRDRVTEGHWRYLDPIQEAFLQTARDDLDDPLPRARSSGVTGSRSVLALPERELRAKPSERHSERKPAALGETLGRDYCLTALQLWAAVG